MFRRMVNDSIRIGLANDVSSLRRLSLLSYSQLADYDSPSCYKLCAISRAAEYWRPGRSLLGEASQPENHILSNHSSSPVMVSRSGMGTGDSSIKREASQATPHRHTLAVISQPGVEVRSFTLTRNKLCLSIAREAPMIACVSTVGVDRNLRNLTVGNDERHITTTSQRLCV